MIRLDITKSVRVHWLLNYKHQIQWAYWRPPNNGGQVKYSYEHCNKESSYRYQAWAFQLIAYIGLRGEKKWIIADVVTSHVLNSRQWAGSRLYPRRKRQTHTTPWCKYDTKRAFGILCSAQCKDVTRTSENLFSPEQGGDLRSLLCLMYTARHRRRIISWKDRHTHIGHHYNPKSGPPYALQKQEYVQRQRCTRLACHVQEILSQTPHAGIPVDHQSLADRRVAQMFVARTSSNWIIMITPSSLPEYTIVSDTQTKEVNPTWLVTTQRGSVDWVDQMQSVPSILQLASFSLSEQKHRAVMLSLW